MATRRKPVKRKPAKRPAKRREPRDELDILADELERVSKREDAAFRAGWDKFMAHLGIADLKPIGAKKVREMMIKEGYDPNSNAASQEIIRMREE